MIKLLVSTLRTQGDIPGDYSFVPEGEFVGRYGLVCDRFSAVGHGMTARMCRTITLCCGVQTLNRCRRFMTCLTPPDSCQPTLCAVFRMKWCSPTA
jgi:hypothetical protein